MKKSLIYIDPDNVQNSADLFEVCDLMYGTGNCETYAVVFNDLGSIAEGLADRIILVKDETIDTDDLFVGQRLLSRKKETGLAGTAVAGTLWVTASDADPYLWHGEFNFYLFLLTC